VLQRCDERILDTMIKRDAVHYSKGNVAHLTAVSMTLNRDGWGLMHFIEGLRKKRGIDVERLKRYLLNRCFAF